MRLNSVEGIREVNKVYANIGCIQMEKGIVERVKIASSVPLWGLHANWSGSRCHW